MKRRLFNLSFNKRYSFIRILFVIIIFLFSSHVTQSTIRFVTYEVNPNVPIKTDKIKAEVLFIFEQTLIESGFEIDSHVVSGENRYVYVISLSYKDIHIYGGELVLFHAMQSNIYILERVLFGSTRSAINELGDEIVSDLIITPFKAKVSE
jgi:hypothetical protein